MGASAFNGTFFSPMNVTTIVTAKIEGLGVSGSTTQMVLLLPISDLHSQQLYRGMVFVKESSVQFAQLLKWIDECQRWDDTLHSSNSYLSRHDNALPGPEYHFYNDWDVKSLNRFLHRSALLGRAQAGPFPQDWAPVISKLKELTKLLTKSNTDPSCNLWFDDGGNVDDTHVKFGAPCFKAQGYGESADDCLADLVLPHQQSNAHWTQLAPYITMLDFNLIDHTGTTITEAMLPDALSGATVDIAFVLRGWKFGSTNFGSPSNQLRALFAKVKSAFSNTFIGNNQSDHFTSRSTGPTLDASIAAIMAHCTILLAVPLKHAANMVPPSSSYARELPLANKELLPNVTENNFKYIDSGQTLLQHSDFNLPIPHHQNGVLPTTFDHEFETRLMNTDHVHSMNHGNLQFPFTLKDRRGDQAFKVQVMAEEFNYMNNISSSVPNGKDPVGFISSVAEDYQVVQSPRTMPAMFSMTPIKVSYPLPPPPFYPVSNSTDKGRGKGKKRAVPDDVGPSVPAKAAKIDTDPQQIALLATVD
ncbi:uncharacterized protein C8R40DRAFT_1071825 [Lentinula edodes]|uniref:uncharacterized protein n=1 Tax=Lentinula edodes TaxID=5353 RepID=UPI001E8D0F52|nr:uncharacterized protein C8R40DRAFT_1071825 [Lentinula edodes]KAH7872335.1 hypothetical protein C8R40DRAFT_1071825 [Lentinula edodes]